MYQDVRGRAPGTLTTASHEMTLVGRSRGLCDQHVPGREAVLAATPLREGHSGVVRLSMTAETPMNLGRSAIVHCARPRDDRDLQHRGEDPVMLVCGRPKRVRVGLIARLDRDGRSTTRRDAGIRRLKARPRLHEVDPRFHPRIVRAFSCGASATSADALR